MKNAKLVAEYETNVCAVRVYYDVDPQTYYMSLTSGTRNEIRLFGPFKREHLENLVEALKDVKEMKGKHYYMDSPPLVDAIAGADWAVSATLVEVIKDLIPVKGTILELGSGEGTVELSEFFTVYSVEHDPEWLGKYKTNYIHAPLKEHKPVGGFGDEVVEWYDPDVLRGKLPKSYDLLLVDGPPKNRSGFIKYFELFRADVPIIFDDVNRSRDMTVMTKIAARLSRPYTVYGLHEAKHFGIILP